MPHKGMYTKEESEKLKERGIKSGTKAAHKVIKKKKRISEGGYLKG